MLKVRLEKVYAILDRTLTTLDKNPELIGKVLQPVGDEYLVRMNGRRTATFRNTDNARGASAGADPEAGFVGVVLRRGEVVIRRFEAVAGVAGRTTTDSVAEPPAAAPGSGRGDHG